MKRDMDLVRKIVLFLEDHPRGFVPQVVIDGYSSEQIGYHVYLLAQAGLVTALECTTGGCGSPQMEAESLTWNGHEFAENARSDTVWNRAKGVIRDKVGTASIAVMVEVLKQQARHLLGLS